MGRIVVENRDVTSHTFKLEIFNGGDKISEYDFNIAGRNSEEDSYRILPISETPDVKGEIKITTTVSAVFR